MKHLTTSEIEELTALLKDEKKTLEMELSEHGRKVGSDWIGTPSGFGAQEPDDVDTADRFEELATNIPLVEELEKRHTEVVDALERISKGTYGVTDEGNEIPVQRLRANPAARTNV